MDIKSILEQKKAESGITEWNEDAEAVFAKARLECMRSAESVLKKCFSQFEDQLKQAEVFNDLYTKKHEHIIRKHLRFHVSMNVEADPSRPIDGFPAFTSFDHCSWENQKKLIAETSDFIFSQIASFIGNNNILFYRTINHSSTKPAVIDFQSEIIKTPPMRSPGLFSDDDWNLFTYSTPSDFYKAAGPLHNSYPYPYGIYLNWNNRGRRQSSSKLYHFCMMFDCLIFLE